MSGIQYIFHLTSHFRARLIERNIDINECKEVVRTPDTREIQGKGKNGGNITRLTKSTNDGGKLIVVIEHRKNEIWLISCFRPTLIAKDSHEDN
jgi:hypothetical protein